MRIVRLIGRSDLFKISRRLESRFLDFYIYILAKNARALQRVQNKYMCVLRSLKKKPTLHTWHDCNSDMNEIFHVYEIAKFNTLPSDVPV